MSEETIKKLKELYSKGESIKSIAITLGYSYNCIYNYVRLHKLERNSHDTR